MILRTSEQIRDAIFSFAPQIEVSDFKVFKSTFSKYPLVGYYVEKVSYYSKNLGFSTVVILTYGNKETLQKSIHVAYDQEDIDCILHECVSNYECNFIISAPKGVSALSYISSFFNTYSPFYSNLTKFDVDSRGAILDGHCFYRICATYRIGRVMLNIMEKLVDEKVKKLNDLLFCEGMSDGVKAFVAHNYLAKSVTYYNDDEADPLRRSYMQSAYGALIDNKCVCQGYAEAYKRILDFAGIKCEVISGKIKGHTEYHAWNMVYLEGEWHHVDVTWDSLGDGQSSLEHFLKPDCFFAESRLWSRKKHMVCNGKSNPMMNIKTQLAFYRAKFIAKGVPAQYLG
ncbi:MAG: hypothetical protein IJW13_04765 [Clostridia bacterium]|nr:hypothetical protein [Clostridia bacterium]